MNIVHTKKELRAAIKRGDAEIVVGTVALAILTPAIAAAPFTFGASLFAMAAATGVELAIIIAAIAVGHIGRIGRHFPCSPPGRLVLLLAITSFIRVVDKFVLPLVIK